MKYVLFLFFIMLVTPIWAQKASVSVAGYGAKGVYVVDASQPISYGKLSLHLLASKVYGAPTKAGVCECVFYDAGHSVNYGTHAYNETKASLFYQWAYIYPLKP